MEAICQGKYVSPPKSGQPCDKKALPGSTYCRHHKNQRNAKPIMLERDLREPLYLCWLSGEFELLCELYQVLRNTYFRYLASKPFLRVRAASPEGSSLKGDPIACYNIEEVKEKLGICIVEKQDPLIINYITDTSISVIFFAT